MRRSLPLVLFLAGAGCARVDASLHVLNGLTPAGDEVAARRAPPTPAAVTEPGRYALTASYMATRLRYVQLQPEGIGPAPQIPLADCEAIYDRALPSLTPVGDCAFTVTAGTYTSLRVGYTTTFDVMMEDTEAGIWSNPAAPGGLTDVVAEGGASVIEAVDPNTDPDEAVVEVFFTEPLVVADGDAPVLSIVFDPTHWMKSDRTDAGFSAPLAVGNPPLMPTVGTFAASAYYTDRIPTASYRTNACMEWDCISLLFLYREADVPASVTWQDANLCPGAENLSPVVLFDGDTGDWGAFGRLGLDTDGVLAWASAQMDGGDNPKVGHYTGVYRMPEAQAPGETVAFTWRCGDGAPVPASGDTYASGAPEFTPSGTTNLTLRY